MSSNALKNGRPSIEQPIRLETDTVPFLETGNSTPKFGSVNAASTRVDDDGLAETAVTTFQTLSDDIRRRPLTETFDLDFFAGRELLPGIVAAVMTLSDLADVAADDLPTRRRVLSDLASGKGTRLRRRIVDVVNEHVEQAVRPLRVAIEGATARAPYAFVRLADALILRLRTLELSSPPANAYVRFVKLFRLLSLFDKGHRGLPPQIVRRLIDQPQRQLDATYIGAIEETVQQLLIERLRGTVIDLVPFVEERRQHAKQFIDHLFQAERLLEERRTAERHRACALLIDRCCACRPDCE